jgi:hypothetical protein
MVSRPKQFASEILTFIDEAMLRMLREDVDFMQSTTFREQCFYACRVLRETFLPVVPYAVIGRLFNVDGGTIRFHRNAYKERGNAIANAGRPATLTREQLDATVQMIVQSYHARKPVTIVHVKEFIWDTFGIEIVPNTLHHILDRDPRIKSCKANPMDKDRMDVSIEAVRNWFIYAAQELQGIPAHFLFNMDEMGHQNWADAAQTHCYVPRSVEEDVISYPVPRTGKRITLIACISADGSYTRPAIVISRKTWNDELVESGLTNEKLEIYSQPKAFIDGGIFEDWFRDTFIVELQRRRAAFSYYGWAALIMDNCSAHRGDLFEQLCRTNQVKILWLPPHSSNQLQMLDLSVFGITKRLIIRINKLEAVNVQTDHIVRVVNGFMSAAVPKNIIASFRNAGITVKRDASNQIWCHVTPETARCLFEPEKSLTANPEEEDDPNIEVFQERCVTAAAIELGFE